LEYYDKALNIYETLDDKLGIARAWIDMAKFYSKRKDFRKAIELYSKTLKLVKTMEAKSWETSAYEGISQAYEGLNDHEKALKYYKLYTAIKDSALNSENFEKIADMKAQYEIDKKEKERDILENRKEVLRQAQLSKQKLIRNVLIGASLFVIAFAFWRARIKQRANKKLASAYVIIEEKNKDITDSISYAKGIQESILPTNAEIKKLLPESFVLYQPKDIVSGDFYFIEPINTNDKTKLIGFAAADCTGHGVPGAFMSIFGVNILRQSLTQHDVNSPAEVLDFLNRNLHIALRQQSREKHIQDGMDIVFCVLNPNSNDLYFAGANNPLWIVKHDKSFTEIKGDKQPIGYYPDQKPFSNHTLKLNKGDTIYIFTDGYADQFGGEKGKKFKYKKLQELLVSINEESMEKQKEILRETITEWKGKLEQVDDILIIGVRI
jgi:serine phosphatase RsbU (regulator of sigma subunit)